MPSKPKGPRTPPRGRPLRLRLLGGRPLHRRPKRRGRPLPARGVRRDPDRLEEFATYDRLRKYMP
jgi:hypothetical protein